MGLKSSLHESYRFLSLAEDFVRGDQLQLTNSLRWHYLKLNFPEDDKFDPSMHFVYKYNNRTRSVANDSATYMDNARVVGASVEDSWQVGRRYFSRWSYLGIQEATPKILPPHTKGDSAWVRAMFISNHLVLLASVTKEKWKK